MNIVQRPTPDVFYDNPQGGRLLGLGHAARNAQRLLHGGAEHRMVLAGLSVPPQ